MSTIRKIIQRLRNTAGAIDLSSIMVGIIVIGVFFAVVAASVFGVIPWTQDRAAAQELDAVSTAQSVSRAMHDKYLDYDTLAANGTLPKVSRIGIGINGDGTCWTAVAASATGKKFYIDSEMTKPVEYVKGATSSSCSNVDSVADAAAPGGGATPPAGGGATPPPGGGDGTPPGDGGSTPPGDGGSTPAPALTFVNDATIDASALTGSATTLKASAANLAGGQQVWDTADAVGLTNTGGMGGAEFSEKEWDFSVTAVSAHASNGAIRGAVALDPSARLTVRKNNDVDWDTDTITPRDADITVTGLKLTGLSGSSARDVLSNGYIEFQTSNGFIFRIAIQGQDGIVS